MTDAIDSANSAASTLFLGHNGQWWDFWLIVSVVIAALAAMAICVTSAGSILAHKREADSSKKATELFKLGTERRISDSNARAAEAAAKAESERLERVKLEARLSPRRLSGNQRDAVISALEKVPAPPTIVVVSRLLDTEGNDFADDIANALAKAGWHAERFRNWTMGAKGLFVAVLEGTNVSPQDPALQGVERALSAADLDPKPLTIEAKQNTTMTPYFQPNILYVLVGSKP